MVFETKHLLYHFLNEKTVKIGPRTVRGPARDAIWQIEKCEIRFEKFEEKYSLWLGGAYTIFRTPKIKVPPLNRKIFATGLPKGLSF